MLQRLKIKNIALIEECVLEFHDALNILTGETGAGKSLIIDSLNFVLGARADKTLIKTGQDFASVEAVFWVNEITPAIAEFFETIGEPAEQTIIIYRYLNVNGRTDIKVNGQTVTNSMLKKLTVHLVDMHGQHAHQALLEVKNHIMLFDSFGNNQVMPLKEQIVASMKSLKEIDAQIALIGGSGKEREHNIALLQFQLEEIENAHLSDGEEAELTNKKTTMLNSEKIFNGLKLTTNVLSEDSFNVLNQLKSSLNQLKSIMQYDTELQTIYQNLEASYYVLIDQSELLNDKMNSVYFDENELNQMEERLDEMKGLKRKYGPTIDDVLTYAQNAAKQLDDLLHAEEKLNQLTKQRILVLETTYKQCALLTETRKAIAKKVKTQMQLQLADLGMKHAEFDVVFLNEYNKDNLEQFLTQNGADQLEFMFSANLGEPLKPLSKIISGGEMSRFMLAMKCVLNESGNKTVVFDEIDNGIGGVTGLVVAQKLSQIGKHSQVICVTHLAQIASFADEHYFISKTESDGKTKTKVTVLNEESNVTEISRLLGSHDQSAAALNHAKEMLLFAKQTKNQF